MRLFDRQEQGIGTLDQGHLPELPADKEDAMTWRGLLCGPESVRAYLAGTKTQTRRVVKWPTKGGSPHPIVAVKRIRTQLDSAGTAFEFYDGHGCNTIVCPYGRPGDGLYVREAFSPCACDACLAAWPKQGPHGVLGYKADGNCRYTMKSGRFMPRWAARIFRELVEVQVERVQAIHPYDAIAEGVMFVDQDPTIDADLLENPRERFRMWWDSLNAKRGHSWKTNPWVWILTTKETEQRP